MSTISNQSSLPSGTVDLRSELLALLNGDRESDQESLNSDDKNSREDRLKKELDKLLRQYEESKVQSPSFHENQLQTRPGNECECLQLESSGICPRSGCHQQRLDQAGCHEGSSAVSHEDEDISPQTPREESFGEKKPPNPGKEGVKKIRATFVELIDPGDILHYFHKYDLKVLSQRDMERVRAKTETKGRTDGALLLLEVVIKYEHWWWCLLKVLRDPSVKLGHIADEFELALEEDSSSEEDDPQNSRSNEDYRPERTEGSQVLPSEQYPKRKNVLLLGKTGEGKSATGNSILGREAFKSACSANPVTERLEIQFCNHDNRNMMIVDAPGLFDAEESDEKANKVAVEILAEVILTVPEGYDAILFVLKCGGRFRQEDKNTLTLLKEIYGEDFISNHCVLVLTHVDVFTRDNTESANEWVKRQGGFFKEMLDAMDGRFVFFNNKTKDESTKQAQVNEMMRMMDRTSQSKYTYRNPAFHDAIKEKGRQVSMCRDALMEIKQILEESNKMTNAIGIALQHNLSEALEKRTSCLFKKAKLLGELHKLDDTTRKEFYSGIKSLIEDLSKEATSFHEKLTTLLDKRATLDDRASEVPGQSNATELFAKEQASLLDEYKQSLENLKLKLVDVEPKSKKGFAYYIRCFFEFILYLLEEIIGAFKFRSSGTKETMTVAGPATLA